MKIATWIFALLSFTSPIMSTDWSEARNKTIRYTAVGGYFLQDDPATNATGFDYAQTNFGLIDREYPSDAEYDPRCSKSQWERFRNWIHHLNNACGKSENVRYKVIFFGRHGQGYHNVAESTYGTPAWNCYWSLLDGNGTSTWADALLTPVGVKEAQKASNFYKTLYEQQRMPHFETYYSSPLRRCIQTANTTFGTLNMPSNHPFVPTIKELLREDISPHTCDRRSSKSELEKFIPGWKFEAGFTEKDELWKEGEGETPAHALARTKSLLDDVFIHDRSTWISITSHSGAISFLLKNLNHRTWSLSTGQIIPVLIKAEAVAPSSTTTSAGFTPEASCKQPPITSLPDSGCVCSSTGSIPSPSGP